MTQIRTPDQRLRIFVSSTMNEMADERAAIKRAIERLRLTPVMFELGARPYPPRELYLAYLQQSDVFVGVYGQQYGWIAPGRSVSGLEDEFLAAADKPRLVYVQSPAAERDPRLSEMLKRIQQGGLSYHTFRHARDLARLVSDDLAILLSDRFGPAQGRPSSTTAPRRPTPIGRDEPGVANRFIGRTEELAALRRLLADRQSRLVTLVGPGGIGKTRLALQCLATSAVEYDSAAVAELDQVPAAQPLVTSAIAAAIGVPETAGTPLLDSVADFLNSRRVLLLLDGFEHLVDAAPLVAELVSRTTPLTVLVTSRENLHLTGERVFEVPPLALPSWSDSFDAVRRSDAVELFVDRAAAAGATMSLDDTEVRTIAQICQRLDGLPLAIELAASRARMLDPPELARRLDAGLETLTSGARDLPPRQQALRSTIAWSYDLLNETEQCLFGRLGVFAGGFSLDAAEALCGDERVPHVFDGIASLVDKALLRPDHTWHGQPRFAMLQVIREFAVDRLTTAGERDRLSGRHADYYRDLVVEAARLLRAGNFRPAVDLHRADDPNILAALNRFIDARDGDSAAQMGEASWPLWFSRGRYTEGQEAMERVLSPGMRLSDDRRTDANLVLGMMMFERGVYEQLEAVLTPVLDQYIRRGDAHGSATASLPLGVVAGLRRARDGDDLLRRAVDDMRRLDDQWGLGFAQVVAGTLLVHEHREADAIGPLEEAIGITRAGHDDLLLSNALIGLAWAHIGEQNLGGAKESVDDGLRLAVDFAHQETIARALDAIAAIAGRSHDAGDAATLLGGAEHLRRSVGGTVWEIDRAGHADTVNLLRDTLGPDAYERLYRQGAGLSVDDLLGLAAAVDSRH